MIYWHLFSSFFKIGLFAIGGAYSFLPLTEREIVEKYHWLSKPEFLDISGFVKIFPGAISVKYATYVGYKMAGYLGAFVANLANLLAPATFVLIATIFYNKYKAVGPVKNAFSVIQIVIFAMIIAVAFQTINIKQISSAVSILIVAASFSLFMFTKLEPALIILAAGILGAFIKIN
ncbi:MAG TPA: chromate transporter [Candidatus Omnitrophota bacterium]|nr:chromate transporter [Candidatus Omnitrophota bacterium]